MGKQYKNQDYLIKVGRRLAAIREEKKITQEKLQDLTGFDTRQIGRIERAETNASISIVKAIADSLDISVGDILNV